MNQDVINRLAIRQDLRDERRRRKRDKRPNTREGIVMTSKMVRNGGEGDPEVSPCLTENVREHLHCTSASTIDGKASRLSPLMLGINVISTVLEIVTSRSLGIYRSIDLALFLYLGYAV